MRHTFKASFEQQSDAQHLMEELSAAGFTGAELALSGATHAGPFTHRRPAVTLTVDAESDAQRVLGIMERCKPARLQDDPAGDDAEAADSAAEAEIEANAGRAMPVYPPGAEPGALQFHHLDDGRYFGTQNAAAPPSGNTFQETMGTASYWNDADETTIRQTAAAPWPDVDTTHTAMDDGAAYRRQDAGEADGGALHEQADEQAHHGWSAWHKVKEALRHGWARGKS
jgi:hypothetical protein